jgi:sec-independent protein translocase protein TatA
MGPPGFIGGLSPMEIAIILVLGLLLFGSRLPQVGRSLGRSLSEFKRGLRGFEDEMHSAEREAEKQLDEEEAARRSAPVLPGVEPRRDKETKA